MFRRQLWFIIWFASGCALDNPTHDCGNGIACPTSLACDLAHRTCVPPDDLEACAGREELAACSTRMAAEGTCHDGLCSPIGCGNGVWDRSYTEGCDDGNNDDGDGCSATCATEGCGNGALDHGEQCDDGNLRSHDGCDSRCTPEVLAWTPLVQVENPAVAYAAGAYDEARHRYVMFGGIDAAETFHGDTLEWDGATWRVLSPQTVPDARKGAAMAYDSARRVVVMFGGSLANGGLAADTWEWDGARWTERTTGGVAPKPRWGHAMAYDTARHRIVLFGGEGRDPYWTQFADTWEWDGTAWIQVEREVAPPRRAWASATYDPRTARVVIAGGLATGPGYMYREDTWFWDGASWQAGPTGTGKREQGTLTFDPAVGLVLVGGGYETFDLTIGFAHASMRVLRDGAWVVLDDTEPVKRHAHVAFYDARLGRVVVAGGLAGSWDAAVELTWAPTDSMAAIAIANAGVTYEALTASRGPDPRRFAALAYDAHTGRTLMYGGASPESNFTPSKDTWELVDDGWHARASTSPGFTGYSLAYDRERRVTTLFARTSWPEGFNAWDWTGTEWSHRPAPVPPPPFTGSSAVFADSVGEIVVTGGSWTDEVFSGSTWTWDGTRWLKRADTSLVPSGAIAYNDRADAVTHFGATLTTWTPEHGWQQSATTIGPNGRTGAGMAFDSARGEVLLAGGNPTTFDLWRLVDGSWSRVIAQNPPAPRTGVSMIFDAVRAQVILVGTDKPGTPLTYRLRWESQGRDDICAMALDLDGDKLVGCADPDCSAACASCGDGACDPLETSRLCPADCGPPAARCGDSFCDEGEPSACPGDCP